MDKDFIKLKFIEEQNHLKKQIKEVEEIVILNNELSKFNWAFIHPYLFGYQLSHLRSLVQSKNTNSENIFKIFAESFFEFETTAFFIDGYFKLRPSLEPFCPLIDESIILCIQRDYAGAINILLPVLEGSMRHYLTKVRGKRNEQIMRTSALLKVFDYLIEDYLQIHKEAYLSNVDEQNNPKLVYDANQINMLLDLNQNYITLWFSIIRSFFKNNLYLDTRTGNVKDNLNRHTIFHGFSADIYYSLENFLKVFNCLTFLSWAYGMADKNVAILPSLGEKKVIYKWKAFEKINEISKLTVDIKSSIYKKYPTFNKIEFENNINSKLIDSRLPKKLRFNIEDRLRYIDELLKE